MQCRTRTRLVGDVALELSDLLRELFLLVFQLSDLRAELSRAQVVAAGLVHLLMGRLELSLF